MKRGTPRHPKTYALAESLSIPLPQAVGILEMLWHHAAQYTPCGDIGALPNGAIAEAVCWNKRPADLMAALVENGWVDVCPVSRYLIHDWEEHCEQSVRKWMERNGKTFLTISDQCPENVRTESIQSPPSREARAKAKASEDLLGECCAFLPLHDEQWKDFVRLYLETGKPLIKKDFHKASFIWKSLDFAQRSIALANLAVHKVLTNPQFIPKPERFLEGGEYARKVVARAANNGRMSAADRIDRAIEEA